MAQYFSLMHIVLETSRLILRRFTNSDADAALLIQLNSDPEVLQYLQEPFLLDIQKAKEILADIILPQYENKLGRWAIHVKENNQFVGWCGLKYHPELDETDLGYRLLQSAWGKGYATEAAAACLKYGFEILHLKRIIGRAHILNTASFAVLSKIGMTYVGEGIVDDCPVKTFEAFYDSWIPE